MQCTRNSSSACSIWPNWENYINICSAYHCRKWISLWSICCPQLFLLFAKLHHVIVGTFFLLASSLFLASQIYAPFARLFWIAKRLRFYVALSTMIEFFAPVGCFWPPARWLRIAKRFRFHCALSTIIESFASTQYFWSPAHWLQIAKRLRFHRVVSAILGPHAPSGCFWPPVRWL